MVLISPSRSWIWGSQPSSSPGHGDIGLALLGVVGGQRLVDQPGPAARQFQNDLGQFANGKFAGIAQIDGAGDLVLRRHQPDQAAHQIVDITEGAGLPAMAVNGDVFALQRLDDEIRHHAAVIGMHARAIGVEDAGHLDAHIVLAVIVEEQGLRATLAFVVAGTRADRIHIAPIGFDLGMDDRVAIHFRGRSLKDRNTQPLGEAQHVDRANDAGLGRLHRIELIVNRRSRTGEVVDFVDLDKERERHIVPHQLEIADCPADARHCAACR